MYTSVSWRLAWFCTHRRMMQIRRLLRKTRPTWKCHYFYKHFITGFTENFILPTSRWSPWRKFQPWKYFHFSVIVILYIRCCKIHGFIGVNFCFHFIFRSHFTCLIFMFIINSREHAQNHFVYRDQMTHIYRNIYVCVCVRFKYINK